MATAQRRLQIYLSADEYQELKAKAHARKTSMASVVREAVHHNLYEPDREAIRRGYDKIESIIGAFEDEADVAERHDDYLNEGRRWGKE